MKRIKKNGILSLILLIVLIFAGLSFQQCTEKKAETKAEVKSGAGSEEGHEEQIIRLTDEELKEFGVEIAEAGPGQLELHADFTGEIAIDPERLAHIVPRFPGIVMEVRKQIGDHVNKGDVLAIIESNESLVSYEVKSLISGTVIEMHLTQGEMITDATHAYLVADLSHVWADLNIYQKDLPNIKVGQTAIITGLKKDLQYTGRIFYISPVVDEETRTATARVVIPNPKREWRPGMFVTAKVIFETLELPVVVPKTALQTVENRTVVFIRTEKGFKPQPVTVGRSNTEFVEIVSGLKKDQQYVIKGGFTIKAELQKESFGDEH